MSRLRCHISMSLDGCVAGLNQSEENPLGEGGERVHEWVFGLAAWRQSHGNQGRARQGAHRSFLRRQPPIYAVKPDAMRSAKGAS